MSKHINKIFSMIQTELKSEKVELEKVELGAIDDLRNDYKKAASKAIPLKKIILKEASDLDKISNELDKVQANAKKLEGMAKELGADSIVKSAKALFDSSGNLSSEWGKSAIKISTAAKNI